MIDRFALLIGAMKAGTTALFHYLRQHPEIAPCERKEPNALCEPAAWRHGLDAYAKLWRFDPARHRWALEASTAYTKLPVRPSAALPARALPAEFRFLYLVRDPIARMRSQYLHSLAEGWIEEPIHADLAMQAVLFSNYRLQLAPYVAAHGRETIRVLSYEDFRARPLEAVHRVCDFLEVEPGFEFVDPGPRNSSTAYRSKLFARLLNARGVLPHPVDLEEAGQLAPASLRALVEPVLAQLGAADLAAEVDAELERAITPTAAQVELVHELLDVDLALFAEEWGIDVWADAQARAPELAAR